MYGKRLSLRGLLCGVGRTQAECLLCVCSVILTIYLPKFLKHRFLESSQSNNGKWSGTTRRFFKNIFHFPSPHASNTRIYLSDVWRILRRLSISVGHPIIFTHQKSNRVATCSLTPLISALHVRELATCSHAFDTCKKQLQDLQAKISKCVKMNKVIDSKWRVSSCAE